MAKGDIVTLGGILFKISLLILALLLALQLLSDQLPFSYDIMSLFSFEQFIFLFSTITISLLAFIEGFTLMKRDSLNFGVIVLYIVSAVGAYFIVLIVAFDYSFNDSTMNTYLGYYLLVGVLIILVNARVEFKTLLGK